MTELSLTAVLADVIKALQEDIATGDITSQLLPAEQKAVAQIMTREPMILCGQKWVNETLRALDPISNIEWYYQDGESVPAQGILCKITSLTRAVLTAERTMLNFLQTLSATATHTNYFVNQLKATPHVTLLDTRKTIPGLRYAQKYAVTCGGGANHRRGLYDAFLIKENHITACGSIALAISRARESQPDKIVEIEVTNLDEYAQALAAKPDIIMLDNFTLANIKLAVSKRSDLRIKLEVSGGVTSDSIAELAATGIDYISTGAITKNIMAIDLTLLLI